MSHGVWPSLASSEAVATSARPLRALPSAREARATVPALRGGALLSASLLASSVMLGCGGSHTGSPASDSSHYAEPGAIVGPPRPWAELSREDRARHMSREVVPRMSALFAAYDGARYADFDCATCHGPDARERDFAMPNPSLLPLHATGTEGQRQAVRDYPEGVRFMYTRVLPTMQALVGAAPFDETTGEGFTCYACHPHAEDGATAREHSSPGHPRGSSGVISTSPIFTPPGRTTK